MSQPLRFLRDIDPSLVSHLYIYRNRNESLNKNSRHSYTSHRVTYIYPSGALDRIVMVSERTRLTSIKANTVRDLRIINLLIRLVLFSIKKALRTSLLRYVARVG